jgi:hypothetical protein
VLSSTWFRYSRHQINVRSRIVDTGEERRRRMSMRRERRDGLLGGALDKDTGDIIDRDAVNQRLRQLGGSAEKRQHRHNDKAPPIGPRESEKHAPRVGFFSGVRSTAWPTSIERNTETITGGGQRIKNNPSRGSGARGSPF